jgi:hypothetical protein
MREFRLYLAKDPGNRQARQLLATALMNRTSMRRRRRRTNRFAGRRSQHSPGSCHCLRTAEAGGRIPAPARRLPRRPEFGGLRASRGQPISRPTISSGRRSLSRRAGTGALARQRSLRTRGRAVEAAGQEGAIEEWRSGAQDRSGQFRRRVRSGRDACSEGNLAEARTLLERARSMRSGDAATLYHLARIDWKDSIARERSRLLENPSAWTQGIARRATCSHRCLRAQGREADAAREFDAVRRLSDQDLGRDVDVLRGASG